MGRQIIPLKYKDSEGGLVKMIVYLLQHSYELDSCLVLRKNPMIFLLMSMS